MSASGVREAREVRLHVPPGPSCTAPEWPRPGPDHSVQGKEGAVEGGGHACIRREGASEAAPEAVRQAVGGGCQSGWGRLLSVTHAVEPGTWRQGDSGWA